MYYYYDFHSKINNVDSNDDIYRDEDGKDWIDSKNGDDDDDETCQFSFCHNLIFSLIEFVLSFFT